MFVVGLTGGIGSGKSTVAKLFSEKGITIIDTDQLARDVIQPGEPALQQIIDRFGHSILAKDGSLDRALLRKKIFADDAERLWLESLLHPLIRKATQQAVTAADSPYCIVVIPLLFETERNPLINRILVIDTPEKTQIERTMARDRLSEEAVRAILKAQISREQRLAGADDIIINDGTLKTLKMRVENLHEDYLKRAKHVIIHR